MLEIDEKKNLTQETNVFNIKDIDRFTKDLIEIIDGREITLENIMFIIPQYMTVAAKYVNLTGANKKKLIIHVLKTFIRNSQNINPEKKKDILMMFDFTIPITIDMLVSASKSEFVFKHKKNIFTWCCI
jgi:hypothetical protein